MIYFNTNGTWHEFGGIAPYGDDAGTQKAVVLYIRHHPRGCGSTPVQRDHYWGISGSCKGKCGTVTWTQADVDRACQQSSACATSRRSTQAWCECTSCRVFCWWHGVRHKDTAQGLDY